MRFRFDPSRFGSRMLGAVSVTLGLLVVGTLGFSLMPGWSLWEAFYMTVITISAVGYGEILPLTPAGRAFASFLIAGGIVMLAIWFALITATLVEMDLGQAFRKRRTMKRIDRIRDHIIMCGAGRTGFHAIKRFVTRGDSYVVIESDPVRVGDVRQLDAEARIIEGDATDDDALAAAGIARARGLVAALSADTDNAFVCLAARELNPDLTIVGRARSEESVSKLKKAGADRVVTPNATGGVQLASLVLRPDVTLFADIPGEDGLALLLEQVPVAATSELAGLTLAEATIPARTGLLVVAIERDGGHGAGDRVLYNPGPEARIRAGDNLVVLGPPEKFGEIRRLLA